MKKIGCSFVLSSLFITVLLIAAMKYAFNIVSEDNTEEIYTYHPAETEYVFEYQPLKELNEDEIYDILCSQLGEYKTEIDLGGYAVKKDLTAAAERVRTDHPEFFWVNGYHWKTPEKSTVVTFITPEKTDSADIPDMYKKLEEAATELSESIPESISDYEKVVFVHDSIIGFAEYDTEGRDSGAFGLWSTAYGCLVEGRAVCSGYAFAFKMIMDRQGIECGIVSGTSEDVNHAWNYVLLDGEYYWIDLTWDDPIYDDGSSLIQHNYCLLDDRFLKDHIPDENENLFIPECGSMEYNYYVKNGTYEESYSFEEVNEMIFSCEEKEYAEIMFSSAQSGEECLYDLFENKRIWDTESFGKKRKNISYSYDEDTLVLKIKMTD